MRKIALPHLSAALFLFLLTLPLHAQNQGFVPCATDEYELHLQKRHPQRQSREGFEQWLAPKIEAARSRVTARNTNTVITIPVVFHILHDGDNVGVDENISDAQIQAQMEVLNQDFRRLLGTPGYNDHPDGTDIELEFCLAQRDPDGEPTTGINRIQTGISSWDMAQIELVLKPQTQWDPEDYLNIWVCRFGGDLASMGAYAQFPVASGLEGLEGSPVSAATDGIAASYMAVGSSDLYPDADYFPDYDKGRTLTHEIGHYFGLMHIWGHGFDCTSTDYCDDTPASTINTECTPTDSCQLDEVPDMIENYMDYTPDACKNVFTNDQKARVMAVLENSPRRNTLANSDGCVYPEELDLDGAIRILDMPVGCDYTLNPVVNFANKGLTTINTAQFIFTVDDGVEQIYNWSGSLATDAQEQITFTTGALAPGNHTFTVNLISVNGIEDEYAHNNHKNREAVILSVNDYDTQGITLTLQRDVFGSDTSWSIENGEGIILHSGGPYTDSQGLPEVIIETFFLPNNDCYTFSIFDQFGDGICCFAGNGYYSLTTDDNTVIAAGDSFGFSDIVRFSKNLLNSDSPVAAPPVAIYPNPSKGIINITAAASMPESYEIYTTLGQLVMSKSITGEQDLSVDVSSLSNGIYIIKIKNSDRVTTLKFIKE